MERPVITLTEEMFASARQKAGLAHVNRTIACRAGTRNDTLTGFLGEYAFCQHGYGDWRMANPEGNKGLIDCGQIEVKASAFPFRPSLNLLVREDYAAKRKPDAYVQVIIDLPDRNSDLTPGQPAILCGWASAEQVDAAPLTDYGAKNGRPAGYRCRSIPLWRLQPMATLPPLW